jgi:hypothetical protein
MNHTYASHQREDEIGFAEDRHSPHTIGALFKADGGKKLPP